MTERKITNLPASIRQRLLQVAQASNRPFQEVLQYYAMERFLFRLSVSPHVERFILKGALMMTAWGASATRPTRDIDLLGYLPNHVESLVEIIREVCRQDVEPDALSFDPASTPLSSSGMSIGTETGCSSRRNSRLISSNIWCSDSGPLPEAGKRQSEAVVNLPFELHRIGLIDG